jgi:invasion protein IalB
MNRCTTIAMMRAVASAAILSLTIAAGGALAQAPSTSASPSGTSAADKQAISKACSDQANAKGLHGKARKKFRSQCKRRGGR